MYQCTTRSITTMDQWGQRVKDCTEIPEARKFEPLEKVEVEGIDGNLNVIARVTGASGRSIVVKHSLPYIKFLGEAAPLGEERIDIEYKALLKFHTLSPGSVPEPYAFDKPNNAVYMEDLNGYVTLRTSLMAGEFDMNLVDKIGHDLAIIHRETHVGKIGEDQLKTLDEEFENYNMTNLVEKFVFKEPFSQYCNKNRLSPEVAAKFELLYGDENVLIAANEMLNVYTHKKECLLHGDLHTGSIMILGSDAILMDVEFSFVGPAAYDLGVLVANFIFSYYRHMGIEEDKETHRNLHS